MYVILNLTVEPLAGSDLKISGAFGEEPVWEDVGRSRRYSPSANPPLSKSSEFAMILPEGAPPETTFRALGGTWE